MTEAVSFSPPMLGKRSSSRFSEMQEEMVLEPLQSNNQSLKKARPNGPQSIVGFSFGGNDFSQSNLAKRHAGGTSDFRPNRDENVLNESRNIHFTELNDLKFQNSQLTTRNLQNEMLAQKQAQENAELKSMNQKLLVELQKCGNDRDAVIEENRILKRAVQIQENRLRDLSEQSQQQQQIIQAAVTYIQEAENEKQLKATGQMRNSYATSHDFHPPPPPNVF